jgi:hypothetical protein
MSLSFALKHLSEFLCRATWTDLFAIFLRFVFRQGIFLQCSIFNYLRAKIIRKIGKTNRTDIA